MSAITVSGLTKSYKKGDGTLDVLRGIDAEFAQGDTVAIVGASGAGKSTFLNILGALDRPSSGEVKYGEQSIFKLDDPGLASLRNTAAGFVFQFHHLLPEFTAAENVMLPALISGQDARSAKKRAEELLKQVGLGQRLEHRPGELSGGEQQRCAIVRALIMGPKIVLADEPTGNLDKKTGEEVFKLLMKMNEEHKITLVVVTHNDVLAGMLSRKFEMTDGKISEIRRQNA